MMITHTNNEPCQFCGRNTHTLAVRPGQGQQPTVCISVPLDEHPVPEGCVEYRTAQNERAFVRALDIGRNAFVGRWLYETASGWPLYEDGDDDVPADAKRRARELNCRYFADRAPCSGEALAVRATWDEEANDYTRPHPTEPGRKLAAPKDAKLHETAAGALAEARRRWRRSGGSKRAQAHSRVA